MTNEQEPIHAVVVQPHTQALQAQVNEPPLNIKLTYAYSKTVQMVATIEAVFLILYGFYKPWLFVQAIGPIIGYYGAKKYNKPLSYFYFAYIILALLSKFIIIALTFQSYLDDSLYIILVVFTIIIDFWVLKLSSSFLHYLQDLTPDELHNIKNIRIVTTYLYW